MACKGVGFRDNQGFLLGEAGDWRGAGAEDATKRCVVLLLQTRPANAQPTAQRSLRHDLG